MIIETKFDRKQEAWAMLNNRPRKVVIDGIYVQDTYLPTNDGRSISIKYNVHYTDGHDNYHSFMDENAVSESRLFATKQELIETL